MNTQEFSDQIYSFPNRYTNRNLEEYLRALYMLVMSHSHIQPNAFLFVQLLEEAFTAVASDINLQWLDYRNAPDANIVSHKFTNPLIRTNIDKSVQTKLTNFEYLIAVLTFQIAELYQMRDKELKNELRYYGVTSESGNIWNNFDPFTNLQCGIDCYIDNLEEEPYKTEIPSDWAFLGQLLEFGRIYE
ncbi:hypothetical protein QNI19_13925 [Cytophagaceae bacterium DM2B3-1]|uniref:Uncharacterized protein n=1 Tax=Xanthocytophaga flava TaxID=3048013 RepID=A0ABT7CJW9_9BACT|nr:hypothetical protein [Xanthocytophaga flavus]MDJ1469452.1 hypothetical protein [Xanthocytophaga flavus]MDJ1494036.1 hypothetical protein [Xanthocytophaga flavus]